MSSWPGFCCLLCLFGISQAEVACEKGIDLMFLQDTSGSFQDDMANMRAQLPTMIAHVKELFPNSRTGVAEFRDKPYFPLGETSDFCYKVTKGELSFEAKDTEFAYSILRPSGGADLGEDPYQAIINVVQDKNLAWRPLHNHVDPSSGEAALEDDTGLFKGLLNSLYEAVVGKDEVIARVVVLITDAVPHKPGDGNNYPPNPAQPTWIVPQELPPNSGVYNSSLDEDISCLHEDYASDELMAKLVNDYGATVLVIHTKDVSDTWSKINDDVLKQPEDYRQIVDEQSSSITEVVTRALKALATNKCDYKEPKDMQLQAGILSSSEKADEETLSVIESGTSSTPPVKRRCCPKKCKRCRKCRERAKSMLIELGDKPKHFYVEYES